MSDQLKSASEATELGPEATKPRQAPVVAAMIGAFALAVLFWARPPFSFGYDPEDEKCIPDLHLALMLHEAPKSVHDGDLVFFKPSGPLSYVKHDFVMKQVAGVTGDHLQIRGDKIFINGALKAQGLLLSGLYHVTPNALQRDEIIPMGKLFVIGTNPKSDDSRYWGYLDVGQLSGHAYKVL